MKTAQFQPKHDATPWPVAWTRRSGKPQGVALVATLIMLSLVTFMTVAFLGVARRERRSMEAHINQGDAQTAMEAGLNMAQVELVTRLLSVDGNGLTDPWGYSLTVSTNFINPIFNPSSSSPTNVNDVQAVAAAVGGSPATWLQNLANLQYLPRVPVYDVAYTNGDNGVFSSGESSIEARFGRFFVDFNRNGMFEPTFRRYQSNTFTFQVGDTNWMGIPNGYSQMYGNFVGDPHWIGMLENPNAQHSPSNRFIARYAFLMAPAGKAIDLNHAHNQNKLGNVNRLTTYGAHTSTKVDGFIRNQGVGSWEMNMAGLLAELNTNYWLYGTYDNTAAGPSLDGAANPALAFHHALGLLQYRWNDDLVNLTNIFGMYDEYPSTRMTSSGADFMGDSLSLDFGTAIGYYPPHINVSATNPLVAWNYSWAGATNSSANDAYRYNSVNDLWSSDASLANFKNGMIYASTNAPDYSVMTPSGQQDATTHHYTWYRMLEQVETESRPREDRVNLNWDNLNSYISGGVTNWDARFGFPDSVTRVTPGTGQTTESFASWSALRFFTNVAQAIFNSSVITNVRIYNTNAAFGEWSLETNYSIGGPFWDVFGSTNIFSTNLYTRVSAGQTRVWTNSTWVYRTDQPIPMAQTNGTTEYETNVYHTLPINRITVFPVNQLTPEVQRLLQVSANLYETAGNAREWVPNNSYPVNSQVRRDGVYYRNTSVTSVEPPSSPWVLDGPGLPAVFRPIFSHSTNNGLFNTALNSIYISDWVEAGNPSWVTNVTYLDVNNPDDRATLLTATLSGLQADYTLKGFPVFIGAKASTRDLATGTAQSGGLPNFNEVSYSLMAEVTRKLQFVKTNYGAIVPDITNQLFVVGLKAGLGAEVWNPYQFSYPRELDLYLTNYMTVTIQNEAGPIYTNNIVSGVVYNVPAGTWPTAFPLTNRTALITPLGGYVNILSNAAYYPSVYSNLVTGLSTNGGFRYVNSQVVNPGIFVMTNLFPEVQMKVVFSNWLSYAAVDRYYNRVIDYVNLGNLSGTIDLVDMLLGNTTTAGGLTSFNGSTNGAVNGAAQTLARFFSTNRYAYSNNTGWLRTTNIHYITEGISNQIRLSWDPTYPFSDWREFSSSSPNIAARQTFFRRYLGRDPQGGGYLGTNAIDAPFSPTIMAKMDLTFEANDPLVHYAQHQLIGDRSGQDTNFAILTGFEMRRISTAALRDLPALIGLPGSVGRLNDAFSPWGGHPLKNNDQAGPVNRLRNFNLAIKDPGIYEPWQWEFPERRFGSLGWMGRVHRGTPWQTIYMKSRVAYPANWFGWSGAYGTHPTNDWRIFDNLTVAVNKAAASGALSVNQTNRAAWSAVLSGVNVVSNSTYSAGSIFPSGSSFTITPLTWQFRNIHEGIELQKRLQTSFVRHGDILSVPELSDASPYLTYGVQRYNPASAYVQSDFVVYRGIVYGVIPTTGIPAGIAPPTLRDHLLPVYDIGTAYVQGTYVRYNGQLWYANGAIAVGEVPGDAANSWFHGWEVYRNDIFTAERYGFTDNMVEKIPQSIMGLLKLEPSPRVAVYSFGQSLAPAANSVYLFPGVYQNMVTNYQVIGESASRAVLRVEGIPPPGLLPAHTNLAPVIFPRVVVEDYKVMADQ
jgi:hypothetical protein